MRKLKDSTLFWLTVSSKHTSDRVRYGYLLSNRIKKIRRSTDNFISKLTDAAGTIQGLCDWQRRLYKAMGNQKSEFINKAIHINDNVSDKEYDNESA